MPKILSLQEWMRHHFYSAFVVSEHLADNFNVLAHYRPLPMLGAPEECIGRVHSNLLRSSFSGLPRGWEMFVLSWHFSANRPLTEPLLEWASEVAVEFIYNNKRYAQSPLHELLHGELSLAGDDAKVDDQFHLAGIPIWMRENMSFELLVDASSDQARIAKARLIKSLDGQRLVVWGYLSGYLKLEVV
jgi:hypothetical protein